MPYTYKEFLQKTKSLNEQQVNLLRDTSDMMAHIVSNAYLCENGYERKLMRGEMREQDIPAFQKPYKDIRDLYSGPAGNGVAGEIYKLGRIWGEDSEKAEEAYKSALENTLKLVDLLSDQEHFNALIDAGTHPFNKQFDKDAKPYFDFLQVLNDCFGANIDIEKHKQMLNNYDAEKQKEAELLEQPVSELDKWCTEYPKSSDELEKESPERANAKAFEKKTITSAEIKDKLSGSLLHIGIDAAEKQKLGKIYEDLINLLKPASELNKDGINNEQWKNGINNAVGSLKTMLATDGFCKKYMNAVKTEQEFEIKEQAFYYNYKMYYPLDTFNKLVKTLNDNFGAEINIDRIIKDS